MTEPPEDTRAYFRGRCLGQYAAEVVAARWDSVIFDVGRESLVRVPMMEPERGHQEARRRAVREVATGAGAGRHDHRPLSSDGTRSTGRAVRHIRRVAFRSQQQFPRREGQAMATRDTGGQQQARARARRPRRSRPRSTLRSPNATPR